MKKSFALTVLTVFVLSFVLSACGSTTTGSCAYVVGNGKYDSTIDNIIYPGQKVPTLSADHIIRYVPCNSRNYLINDGSKKNANNLVVGDETTLIKAKTMTGTDILIAVSAYWTLNEDENAMKAFYAFQLKYKAASDTDVAGDANSATPGWNNMLGENFGPAMNRAAREGAFLTTDAIWQTGDTAQYKILTDYMTDNIAAKLSQTIGFSNVDLFCGSGSDWPDHNNPGVGDFVCKPIRIVVDQVIRDPDQSNASTEGSTALSQQRLQIARELYGDQAECWLGLQDTVQACTASGSTCVFNISSSACSRDSVDQNGSSPTIILPNNPTPTVAPTATPKP